MTDGYIHNSLRMLWGKKILEWSRDGETAMEIMIHLNDKYALDGRDPNSYSGIGWIMGKFDKPFNERPVIGMSNFGFCVFGLCATGFSSNNLLGTIRWMNSDSSYRKYPTEKFLATYNKVGETLMDWLATDAEPGKKPEPVKFNPDPPKKNSKARRVQNGSYGSENSNRKRGPQKIDSKTQKTIDLKKQLSSFSKNFSS